LLAFTDELHSSEHGRQLSANPKTATLMLKTED
jgi:hypothetical protein